MTGTELLINVMEKFSISEPTGALVIWLDEDEHVRVMGNTGHTLAVGMANFAREYSLAKLMRSVEEEE